MRVLLGGLLLAALVVGCMAPAQVPDPPIDTDAPTSASDLVLPFDGEITGGAALAGRGTPPLAVTHGRTIHTFDVNSTLGQLTVDLSWTSLQPTRLSLTLQAPDGTQQTAHVAPTSSSTNLRLQVPGAVVGEWLVAIAPDGVGGPVRYAGVFHGSPR